MKLSMTSLPLVRVKSPVWLRMIFQVGMAGNGVVKALLAVDGRRGAGRALQFDDIARLVAHRLHKPVAGDLAFEDRVRRDGREVEILRGVDRGSSRITGILASLASLSTASQPGWRPPER